jgi:hypothetical protein
MLSGNPGVEETRADRNEKGRYAIKKEIKKKALPHV